MKDLTVSQFCKKFGACSKGRRWAYRLTDKKSTALMSELWPLISKKYDYFIWTFSKGGVFSRKDLCRMSVRFIKEIKVSDTKTVFDLLTDKRSLAVLIAVQDFIDDKISVEAASAASVASAANAAYAAAYAAYAADASHASAAYAADAAYAATYAAYYAANAATAATTSASSAAHASSAVYAANAAAYAAYAVAAYSVNAAAYAAAYYAANAATAYAANAARKKIIEIILSFPNPFLEEIK